MHNRLNNRLFSFSYFHFFFYLRKQKVYFFNVSIKLSMYISIYIYISTRYIYLLAWPLVNSRKLNIKENNEPCMFSSSYSAKFDRAVEVCFHIMFKARYHYFIQENLFLTCFIKKAGLINPFCTVYCAGISNFL